MKPAVLRWGGVLAASVLGFAMVFGMHVPQAYSALIMRRGEIRRLQRENAELLRQNAEKRQRIQELKENPAIQELEIREKNKKLRKDEHMFILQDQQGKK